MHKKLTLIINNPRLNAYMLSPKLKKWLNGVNRLA
ncbi:hypothetical protein ATW7_11741 [Alteromonadales bacterium TW-7]|nr:hypothetical protein ATW7_11741 [Alteromonadales bacterium TW-7]